MSDVELVILGVAQDGGVPQLGCRCARCEAAHNDPSKRRFATALGLIDRKAGRSWLVEATPQIVEQVELLRTHAPEAVLSGVLITHAHMGHVLGLAHLGREAAASEGVPVYGTDALVSWLSTHAPWSQLVRLGNIRPIVVPVGESVHLSAEIRIEALRVPHRDEFADTVAWSIGGPRRRVLFCPDIDSWDAWDLSLVCAVSTHDVSLLDGTFYDEQEIAERIDRADIPHPTVRETMDRLHGVSCDVRFIHLNHTNPLFDGGSERRRVRDAGFRVAIRGERIALDGFRTADRGYLGDSNGGGE